MNLLVVDGSVLTPVLAGGGEDGTRLRTRLRGGNFVGPDLLTIEVASVLRSQILRGLLPKSQADQAIHDLADLSIAIVALRPLLKRSWELAPNVTPHDACHVALAEVLDAPLLTANWPARRDLVARSNLWPQRGLRQLELLRRSPHAGRWSQKTPRWLPSPRCESWSAVLRIQQ